MLESLVDLDETVLGRLHACDLQVDGIGVWRAPRGDQEMGAVKLGFVFATAKEEPDTVSRATFDAGDRGIGDYFNPFLLEHLVKGGAHVVVFPVRDPPIPFDDGDFAAETPHGLRKFEANEPPA
jgi:hypothetical protein